MTVSGGGNKVGCVQESGDDNDPRADSFSKAFSQGCWAIIKKQT